MAIQHTIHDRGGNIDDETRSYIDDDKKSDGYLSKQKVPLLIKN